MARKRKGRSKSPHDPPQRRTNTPSRSADEPIHAETVASRAQLARISMRTSLHSGPLPDPETLSRYEEIVPGSADRIISMAEANAVHRQKLESAVVQGNVQAQHRGQWFGFVLTVGALAVGTYLISAGFGGIGLTLILTDLLAVAALFVGGKIWQRAERRERRAELEGEPKGESPSD